MSELSITTLALTKAASGVVTQRRGVGFDGTQASVAGQKVLGIAHIDAVAGNDFTVDVAGTAIVETGAAFALGVNLEVDATGRAILSPGTGDVFGEALEASGGAGEFVEVLLRR